MGTKFIREQLHFQPAKLYREEIYTRAYKCGDCEDIDGLAHLIQGTTPRPIMSHNLGSVSVIAEIIYQKFDQGVPLSRQLKDWRRMGAALSETTLTNWIIKSGDLMRPLYNLIRDKLVAQPYLQDDETPMQVIREPDKIATSKSYMWVMRSVRKAYERAVLYTYGSTRSGSFAKNLYRGFTGVLQCDGYAGYNGLNEDVIRVGCFAHVRRKFYETANVNGRVVMSRPLELLDRMFILEREWKQWAPRARRRQRKRRLHKLMGKFWTWIEVNELPKSRLGKAITYAQNQRMALNKIIDYGSINFSNNASERNIKSFVIGRKNWLFSTSPAGAEATAIWMTLIESAKTNGVNPRDYVTYLLNKIPQLPDFAKKMDLEAYLPWNYRQSCNRSNSLNPIAA